MPLLLLLMMALLAAYDVELVNRLLFSFCDDSRLDRRFNARMSFELYSSVDELTPPPRLLNDPCVTAVVVTGNAPMPLIVLGFRDCNGTRPPNDVGTPTFIDFVVAILILAKSLLLTKLSGFVGDVFCSRNKNPVYTPNNGCWNSR